MKTDEFDDIIRQKVESIETQTSESEINAVFKHVKRNQSGYFSKYASYVAISTIAASVAALITWNIMLHKQEQKQDETIAQLTKHIKTLEQQLQKHNTDTIYIDQKTASIQNTTNKSNEYSVEPTQITKARDTKHAIEVIHSNNTKQSKIEQNNIAKSNQNSAKTTTNSISNNSKKANDKNILNDQKSNNESVNTIENKTIETSENTKNEGAESVTKPLNEIDSVSNIAPSENNAIVDTLITTNNQSNDDSIKKAELTKNNSEITPKTHFSTSELFQNIQLRYGLTMDGAPMHWGVGLLGELLIKKRLGIECGLKLSNQHNQHFSDNGDFGQKNGHDFYRTYPSQTSDANNASNIGIRTSIIQIPLFVSYYIPIKSSYSLILSTGTNFDLKAVQKVGFDHRGNMNSEHSDFRTNYPVSFFNSVVGIIGVQKQWKRTALQINPYFSVLTKSVDYKTNKPIFGLQLNVLFR